MAPTVRSVGTGATRGSFTVGRSPRFGGMMSRQHILEGIEPDNLLAFLALLGFHRAMEHAQPAWRPRVYWTGMPLRPRLVLSEDVQRAAVLDAAATGCKSLAEVHSFDDHKDVNY